MVGLGNNQAQAVDRLRGAVTGGAYLITRALLVLADQKLKTASDSDLRQESVEIHDKLRAYIDGKFNGREIW
jgi:hypothetical protein